MLEVGTLGSTPSLDCDLSKNKDFHPEHQAEVQPHREMLMASEEGEGEGEEGSKSSHGTEGRAEGLVG